MNSSYIPSDIGKTMLTAVMALGLRILATSIIILCIATSHRAYSQTGRSDDHRANPNQVILDKLAELETKIDDLAEEKEQVTATFCISQGREMGIGVDWAFEAPIEWEVGLGWAEVADLKATWAPSHPAPIPGPGGIPLPLPTGANIGFAGAHGRIMDICIDIPLEMGPSDTALLEQLASDINSKADDFPNRGKFQRRAHRLLNYAKRRIPGIQTRITSNDSFFATASEPDQGPDDEFDRVDEAVENLFIQGLRSDGSDSAFGIFRDQNVQSLVASFGELPVDIEEFTENPERIFDPISNKFEGSFDELDCSDYGIDSAFRIEKPGVDKLCERLENLPSFEVVENVLSGELIGQVIEALQPILENTSGIGDAAELTKRNFCATAVGQRRVFNKYCGRS